MGMQAIFGWHLVFGKPRYQSSLEVSEGNLSEGAYLRIRRMNSHRMTSCDRDRRAVATTPSSPPQRNLCDRRRIGVRRSNSAVPTLRSNISLAMHYPSQLYHALFPFIPFPLSSFFFFPFPSFFSTVGIGVFFSVESQIIRRVAVVRI